MTRAEKIFIRIATAIIPFKKARKKIRASLLFSALKARVKRTLPGIRERQRALELSCRKLSGRGDKIRVAFLVCDVSMFTAEPIFRTMRSDPAYECFIAVVPRITRGETFLNETLAKTYDTLHSRYGDNVLVMYDCKTGNARPLKGMAELVFTSIIYEEQTCPEFTVESMSEYALVALISYGYSGLFKTNLAQTIFLPNIVFAWKFFVSCRDTLDLWVESNPQLKDNIVLSGYAKMDRLSGIAPSDANHRKKVIISPHHSLARGTDGLSLSNFLRMETIFLELPARYPQLDFVFRPHPLLFPRLATSEWWGKEKTCKWREKITSYPNVEFQQGGDYFETFAQSSALIHDCGSFLAEYFYTSKPQCYILDENSENQFLPFGCKLLNHTYQARTGGEIFDFIDRVVLKGEDPMREKRVEFASSSVCLYYPHAAERICKVITQSLRNDREV